MNLATALSARVTNCGSYLLHHRHRQAVRVEQRWTPTRIFPSCLLHTGRRHLKRVVQRFLNNRHETARLMTSPEARAGEWEWADVQACLLRAEKRSACIRVLQDAKFITALKYLPRRKRKSLLTIPLLSAKHASRENPTVRGQ